MVEDERLDVHSSRPHFFLFSALSHLKIALVIPAQPAWTKSDRSSSLHELQCPAGRIDLEHSQERKAMKQTITIQPAYSQLVI